MSLDLRRDLGAVEVDRDVVQVTGPDATAYLQGQLSQDVEDLDVGATTWSFVLQPTGKVDAWCLVTRTAGNDYVLDVDGGSGPSLQARLRRFLLRTKAEVEVLAGWRCIALRGPGAEAAAREEPPPAELRVPAGWPQVEGADLLGPQVEPPAGVPPATAADYQALRIRSGVPAMGAELVETTIPAETGRWIIDVSVDFTKGCYTGQELVARIDSRGGNVPRHLRGVLVAADPPVVPPPGATLHAGDSQVGVVTSSAAAPPVAGGPAAVALAYVARAIHPPAEATLRWDGGEAPATVADLPLG
jgi:folate-binding protein YgfZ